MLDEKCVLNMYININPDTSETFHIFEAHQVHT